MTNIKSLFFGLFLLTVLGTTYGQTNKFDIGVEGSPSLIFLRGNDIIDNPEAGVEQKLKEQRNCNAARDERWNVVDGAKEAKKWHVLIEDDCQRQRKKNAQGYSE